MAIGDGEISQTGSSTPKIDHLSPFYLGSGDLPNIKLSPVLLNTHNYDDWSRSMRMALKSRRKFGFCDKTVAKPTDSFMIGQWEVVHCTLVSWLRATIDPSVLESVPFVEDAAVMWADLAERFAVVDGTSIHSLKSELGECRQTKDAQGGALLKDTSHGYQIQIFSRPFLMQIDIDNPCIFARIMVSMKSVDTSSLPLFSHKSIRA